MNSVFFIVGYFQRKQKRLGWRIRNDGGLKTLFLVLLVVPVVSVVLVDPVVPVEPVVPVVLVVSVVRVVPVVRDIQAVPVDLVDPDCTR